MLNRIEITNFATIEHVAFDLGEDLNIITGETGSGKSVLVQAISTALGGRADISLIRNGTKKAVIQIAGELKGEDIIITRELQATGKSIARINGEMVTIGQLREFCRKFVDIHGQYDNQQILDPENHLSITDRYHHVDLEEALAELGQRYDTWKAAEKEYTSLLKSEAQARQQRDYFQFEFDHIEELQLKSGEDEALNEQLAIMRNSEKIYEAVAGTYEVLQNNDDSILDTLSRCMEQLQSVASYSEDLNSASTEMTDLYYRLEDTAGVLRGISESINFSEEEINEVSERLSVLEDAKRKYARSIDEIIAYQKELEEKLGIIENMDQAKEQRKAAADAAYKLLEEQADLVSDLRHQNAAALTTAMIAQLKDLAFANTEFEIKMDRAPEIGPLGYDQVEFMISTNPGEPLRPMARIASGGEISRIMLAFKHIIGETDHVDTMIFDEIDTGISGQTALVVGKKLQEIATHHQILCITHLPQIAAYGKDNYSINKDIEDGTSHTKIEHLDADGKLHILARLISGDPNSSLALEAARELVTKAGLQ